MESFSLFSEQYNNLFVENCKTYAKNILESDNQELIDKEYCVFYPSCGSKNKEDIQFLIFGQATNGWKPAFKVKDISENLLPETIEYSNTTDKGEFCPLDWVNKKWSEYKLYRSFFWNVTYKLINLYNNRNIDDDAWRSDLVWTNLMKISPAEGGNPLGMEWESQFEGAKKLFTKEIEEIKPRFVIILTNWDWASDFFLDNQDFKVNENQQGEFIQATGYYLDSTKIIVTKRPAVGNNQQCVDEILDIIK